MVVGQLGAVDGEVGPVQEDDGAAEGAVVVGQLGAVDGEFGPAPDEDGAAEGVDTAVAEGEAVEGELAVRAGDLEDAELWGAGCGGTLDDRVLATLEGDVGRDGGKAVVAADGVGVGEGVRALGCQIDGAAARAVGGVDRIPEFFDIAADVDDGCVGGDGLHHSKAEGQCRDGAARSRDESHEHSRHE